MVRLKDFDYDLWTTTENGTKHYWARIRTTGELTEISRDVMRYLRAEEKRLYREIESTKIHGSLLSIDVPYDEEKEYWLKDNGMGVSEMEVPILEEEFRQLLTPHQLSVFQECMLGKVPVSEYARKNGITRQSVSNVIEGIRKKARKFFNHT